MPILVLDNILTVDFCNHMIEWFESSPDKYDGFVGYGVKNTDIKKSIDSDIKSPEDKYVLNNAYGKCMRKYHKHWDWMPLGRNVYPSPFRMRRYDEGEGFYDWHTDYDIGTKKGIRMTTLLYYLNDTIGGETEFTDGTIIEPKVGRVSIFPSHWSFPHRGKTPTQGSKYIITCFVYDKIN